MNNQLWPSRRYSPKTFLGLALLAGLCVFPAAVLSPAAEQSPAAESAPKIEPAKLWEGRFSQCSFNAVSSALIYYYGPTGSVTDRKEFEQAVFRDPVSAAGYGGYFGWGPWTSYMVESGKMVWNGKPVTDLRAERFSLRPTEQPELKDRLILVHYGKGEREALCRKLLDKLAIGPVVMWTPYAGALDAQFFPPWHHVSHLDADTDAVAYGPFTHSVTLFAIPDKDGKPSVHRVLLTDCSVRNGVYTVEPATIVSTSAAMTAFVRAKSRGEKSILDRGLKGVENDEYNVVFSKSPATTQPAAPVR